MKCLMLKLALCSALMMQASFAAGSLTKVLDKSSEINRSAVNSQNKIDKISDDIDSKLQQFKSVNKETDGLKIYNNELQKQIESQVAEMADLNTSIDKVSVIERQITPLMLRMISGIEEFVALDVPFLTEERQKRISSLKEMMSRADVEVSEKFRRVLEAYQVEVDYGRTIEAYSDKVDINGQPQDVEFLRIGRVALIYQSRDRKTMGIWNSDAGEFQDLDPSYRNSVAKGIRMARKQQAPDMVEIPVYAANK